MTEQEKTDIDILIDGATNKKCDRAWEEAHSVVDEKRVPPCTLHDWRMRWFEKHKPPQEKTAEVPAGETEKAAE